MSRSPRIDIDPTQSRPNIRASDYNDTELEFLHKLARTLDKDSITIANLQKRYGFDEHDVNELLRDAVVCMMFPELPVSKPESSNELTPKQARAYELRQLGWSYEGIARELGLTKGSAVTYCLEARRILRDQSTKFR